MSMTIGEMARLAGVSVRTLHHYDQVGLLVPSGRTNSGYRQYTTADLGRLHQVRVYRERGFDLARIAAILDEPSAGAMEHLRRQHALLDREIGRLKRMKKGVRKMMESKRSGIQLTREEIGEVFGSFDPAVHEEEARERWGSTDAFQESQRRVATYDKAKWNEIKAEAGGITHRFAEGFSRGLAADSEEMMNAAEDHRRHINRWFYECGYAIHQGLGDMYVADPRFAKNYDDLAPGLSAHIRDAIRANARRAEGGKR
jgi:DNA-binding transcriptional MerR regulator